MYSWLALNLSCSWGWCWILDLPLTSIFPVLGLKVFTTMPCLCSAGVQTKSFVSYILSLSLWTFFFLKKYLITRRLSEVGSSQTDFRAPRSAWGGRGEGKREVSALSVDRLRTRRHLRSRGALDTFQNPLPTLVSLGRRKWLKQNQKQSSLALSVQNSNWKPLKPHVWDTGK